MNLDYYDYVLQIVDSGNLSRAAERLFITQSALTQMLKTLEYKLGGPLFEYRERQMKPTYIGKIFLKTAKQIKDIRMDTQNQLSQLSSVTSEHISIAINVQTGSLLVGHTLASFIKRYPNVMIHFYTSNNSSAKNMLSTQSVDFIFFNEFNLSNTELIQYLLFEEDVLLTIEKNTAKELGLPTHTKDLNILPNVDIHLVAHLSFIMSANNTHFRRLIENYFNKQRIIPFIICENPNFMAIQNLVSNNIGVALIPQSLANFHDSNIIHYRITPNSTNMNVLAHRKDYEPSEASKYFISLLKRFGEQLGNGSLL